MSLLPFELLLALRYLRPKRTFVSVITLISVLGVMLGVAVLIIVISVMSGFDRDLKEKIFGFQAHLTISSADGGTMQHHSLVAEVVASNKNVRGVSPFIIGPLLVEIPKGGEQKSVAAPFVRGVDARTEGRISSLPQSIVAGRFDLSGRGVVVGCDFASAQGLRVGDRISIYSMHDLQRMQKSEGKESALPKDYEVRGIFDVGYYEYNLSFVVTSLENAQDLYDLEEANSVHGLLVKLSDPMLAPRFTLRTWLEQSPMLQSVLVEKQMMLYILFFIVLVAAFGITCTLITFIMMKTREIGLMKAVGATNRQVMTVFLTQSLIVSVAGVLCGVALGLTAIRYRNEFLLLMRKWTGMELFPASIYGFYNLPALIIPGDIAIICGGSLIICLIAAALPSWHASRLNPVEALRYE
ncbi:MAG: ABC transporter permease [Verrucomicrobia bacterium]|nr:ABC transporter permease [Verrucomicrobiota bacterium]